MDGLGIILALAGIIVLIAGVYQAVHNRSYAKCSETVIGTVIGKQSYYRKNGRAYELTVSYTVEGIEYKKVVGALLTEFQTIHEGDKLELRYKPDNPKRSVRPTALNPQHVKITLIVGAALLAVGAALVFIGKM